MISQIFVTGGEIIVMPALSVLTVSIITAVTKDNRWPGRPEHRSYEDWVERCWGESRLPGWTAGTFAGVRHWGGWGP